MLRVRAVLLTFALAALAACGDVRDGSVKPPRPNVLIWLVDTLRADHLGCYGYPRRTSPTMDRLAARGVLFEDAHVHSNWTQPSVAALLTGARPPVFPFDYSGRLPDGVRTAAEWFGAHGYATAGFTVTIATAARFGFGRGFDPYVELDAGASGRIRKQRLTRRFDADHVVRAAADWIDAQMAGDAAPFFLFLHTIDTHLPYGDRDTDWPPAAADYQGPQDGSVAAVTAANETSSFAERDLGRLIDLYDGELRYNDAQLGRLLQHLEARGLLADTLVVVVSDHGEEFAERGHYGHGHPNLHRELTHVPLILYWPRGIPGGRRIPGLLRGIDVLPTLADLAGCPPVPTAEGTSAAAAVRGTAPFVPRPWIVIDRSQVEDDVAAVRTAEHLLVTRPVPDAHGALDLFQLTGDPAERIDVAADRPDVVERLATIQARWRAHRATRATADGGGARSAPLSPAEREALRQLGYLGGGK